MGDLFLARASLSSQVSSYFESYAANFYLTRRTYLQASGNTGQSCISAQDEMAVS
jgi:hypothetical protein